MAPDLEHYLRTAMSLFVWLVLLTAIFVPLERLAGRHRQTTLRPQMLADLAYFFMTGLIPTLVLAMPMAVIGATGRQIVPEAYTLWIIGLPIWLQILVALAIGEFGFYWGHRLMHEVPWLWRFHATHHEPQRMDWLINTRAHPVDIILTRMFGLTLVNIAGFGSPGAGSGSLVPVIVLIIGTFWGFFIHANLNVSLPWFEQLLSTPRFHHWHHSRDEQVNRNYASVLPIYDRMFGTFHLPAKAWPPSYGIAPENRPEVLLAAEHMPAPAAERPAEPKTPA
ncbi:sterol desaturase family protein [Rhizorhabdus phycosphaerae]|uniref:sterol desaturase family protein n=1 Tax=Rhizorhabdus phycosphaerae TaxID=2711156 RepID=UPI0013EDFB85|nr:sterol desaturase family protein [Rhizorhabdus phycosphaerae]